VQVGTGRACERAAEQVGEEQGEEGGDPDDIDQLLGNAKGDFETAVPKLRLALELADEPVGTGLRSALRWRSSSPDGLPFTSATIGRRTGLTMRRQPGHEKQARSAP
jgi:hypothetical protein